MNWSWEWVLGITAGGALGWLGRWAWGLLRDSGAIQVRPTIYVEPTKAKELIRDLDRRKEQTLSEIDGKYLRARAEFNDYLLAQRERIVRDLKRPPGDPPKPGKPKS